jgi:hypothetical protein
MDPLSVVVGVVGLSQALGTGLAVLRKILNASSEFREMVEDLSTLQTLSSQLQILVVDMTELQLTSIPREIASQLEVMQRETTHIVGEMRKVQVGILGKRGQVAPEDLGNSELKISVVTWQRLRAKVIKLGARAKTVR